MIMTFGRMVLTAVDWLVRSQAEIKKEHESIAKNLPTGRRGVWDRVSRIIFEAIRVFSQCRRR